MQTTNRRQSYVCVCVCVQHAHTYIYVYIYIHVCVCIYIIRHAHTNRKETHVCVWIIDGPTCACACVRLCAHMQFLFVCADYLGVSPVSVSRYVLFLLLSLHGAVCWCAHEAICVGRVVISQTITEAQDAELSSLDQDIHSRVHTHTRTHTQTFMCGCVCEGMCLCGQAKRASTKLPDYFLWSDPSNIIIKVTARLAICKNLLPPSRGKYSLQCTSVVS